MSLRIDAGLAARDSLLWRPGLGSPRLRPKQCPATRLRPLHVLALDLVSATQQPRLLGATCDHRADPHLSYTLPPPAKWIPTAPLFIPHPRFTDTRRSRPTSTPTSASSLRPSSLPRARTSRPPPTPRPPSPRRLSPPITSRRATFPRPLRRTRIARSSPSVKALSHF